MRKNVPLHIRLLSRPFLIKSLVALFVRGLGAIAGFFSTLYVARMLGADEAGVYFLAFAIVTAISTVSRVGLDSSVVRFTSIASESGRRQNVAAIIRISVSWVLLASFMLVALLFMGAESIATQVFSKPELGDALGVMLWAIPFISLSVLLASVLQGVRYPEASLFILNIGVPACMLLLMFLFAGVDGARIGLRHVAWIYVVAAVFVLMIAVAATVWAVRVGFWGGVFSSGQLLASCLPLLMVAVMGLFVMWGSQLMAGIFLSAADVAMLAVAQRTSMLTSLILVAVNAVAAPQFAHLYQQKDYGQLKQAALRSVRIMVLMALPFLVGLCVFPQFIMSLFGSDFAAGAVILPILACGQFINVMTGSVGYLLNMTGHERDMRNVMIVTGVFSLLLSYALTLMYGLVGAAIATALSVALQNLFAAHLVKRRLGFNTLTFWRSS